MPHISKKQIPLKDLDRLQIELVRSIERACVNNKMRQVFNEFFTRTEKVMFAKRLAIIAMLSKNISPYAIAEVLSVSSSTTKRMFNSFEKDRYSSLVRNALGKKDIWTLVEKILSAGGVLPPKAGGSRWRKINNFLHKERIKNS